MVMLVRFWVNHHLLDLVQRPLWRVVKGRSRTYVQKILAGMPHLCKRGTLLLLAVKSQPCCHRQEPLTAAFPHFQLLRDRKRKCALPRQHVSLCRLADAHAPQLTWPCKEHL